MEHQTPKSTAIVKLFREENKNKLAENCREIISMLGENPSREGLQKTPDRMAKAFTFFTSGYEQRLEDVINGAVFSIDPKQDDMVIVRDIDIFFSL